MSPPQPSLRPAQSPNLLQQQHQNTSSLYFGVGSAHKSNIRKDLVHKRERNLTRKVRGSKGQGGSAGRGVGSLIATPIERWCGDETLRGRENQPELRETKLW